MGPCRARSAPAPPGCRSPSAYPSPPPPARSESLPASRSSQQLDDLPTRLRCDLAADTHARAAAELNLDKPSPLHPPPTVAALPLRHDLDRHHRAPLRPRTPPLIAQEVRQSEPAPNFPKRAG